MLFNSLFKVRLPTTTEEFENLVSKVCHKFCLSDRRHASAVISVAIRHLPNDQGYTTYSYLGHCVLKNIANHIANHKSEVIKHEGQVEQLTSLLRENPNDAQARDELVKAAGEGSEVAKRALESLGIGTDAVTSKEETTDAEKALLPN